MRSMASKAGVARIGRAGLLALPGLLAVLGLLAPSGCVENRASVTVRQMLVPNSSCVATPDSDTFLSMGTLDVGLIDDPAYTTQYFVFPQVENNMISTLESEGIEMNMIEIIEARVTLDFGALGGALDADTTRFRYPAFVTLPAGEKAAIQVIAIPTATARVLASQLPNVGDTAIVRVRLKFLYQHGEYEHETHEVEFPIQICRYCLVTPPSEAVLCDSGLITESARQGNGCNIVQDLPVDCCLAGSQYICPAVDTSETGTTTQ